MCKKCKTNMFFKCLKCARMYPSRSGISKHIKAKHESRAEAEKPENKKKVSDDKTRKSRPPKGLMGKFFIISSV